MSVVGMVRTYQSVIRLRPVGQVRGGNPSTSDASFGRRVAGSEWSVGATSVFVQLDGEELPRLLEPLERARATWPELVAATER